MIRAPARFVITAYCV